MSTPEERQRDDRRIRTERQRERRRDERICGNCRSPGRWGTNRVGGTRRSRSVSPFAAVAGSG